jgi:hypothetical protein
MALRDKIREVADEILDRGGDRDDMQIALYTDFGLTIGHGGKGRTDMLDDFPPCRYCGAWGGGGHGGFCPGASD